MKKIILIIIAILIIVYFFPKPYTSSAGHVTAEMNQAFEASKPTCMGFSYLTNRRATYADAPGKSLCFGVLVKP